MYEQMPKERLFKLLATGGQNGTLKNWYKDEKTLCDRQNGLLSNNHALSGYLITNRGTVLIFSFMNSNFVNPSSEIREVMQDFLKEIRNKY